MFYLPMPPAPLQLIFFFSFFFNSYFSSTTSTPLIDPTSTSLHLHFLLLIFIVFVLHHHISFVFLHHHHHHHLISTVFHHRHNHISIDYPSPPPPHLTIPLGNSKRSLLKLQVQSLIFLSWVFLSTERAYSSFPLLKNLETILFAKALLLHGLYPSSIQDYRSTRSRQKII